jgi:hypothetical protein
MGVGGTGAGPPKRPEVVLIWRPQDFMPWGFREMTGIGMQPISHQIA